MRACTFISKLFLLLALILPGSFAFAQADGGADMPTPPKKEEPGLFDQSTPYLEYGDFDLKMHYWFDFQLAMNIGIFFASHTFESDGTNNVRLLGYGVDLKYSFDVRNASAPISFSNPFLVAGVGSISKTISTITRSTTDMDSTLSINFGAGLEFPIVFKKTYFILDTRYHTQNFDDSNDTEYRDSKGIPDLTGGFFTVSGHILFTW
jgi:hypothetical protein